ncbi:hypothetical protein HDV00_004391 [Rhizophlyctis rosea]|nr:hypothetical protein HDV00_004391 [Rhizophlyctis rosea]
MSKLDRPLFVLGINPDDHPRDLAHAFKRYGKVVCCTVPVPRAEPRKPKFAFVEFENAKDADEAYEGMHEKMVNGHVLSVRWCRSQPYYNNRYKDITYRPPPTTREVVTAPPLLRNGSSSSDSSGTDMAIVTSRSPSAEATNGEDNGKDHDKDHGKDHGKDHSKDQGKDKPKDSDKDKQKHQAPSSSLAHSKSSSVRPATMHNPKPKNTETDDKKRKRDDPDKHGDNKLYKRDDKSKADEYNERRRKLEEEIAQLKKELAKKEEAKRKVPKNKFEERQQRWLDLKKREKDKGGDASGGASSAEKKKKSSNDTITLNIKSHKYTLLLSTLLKDKDSFFYKKYHDYEPDDGEEVFLDRDGGVYEYVVEWLRDGERAVLPVDEEVRERVRKEAEWLGLGGLARAVEREMRGGVTYLFKGVGEA